MTTMNYFPIYRHALESRHYTVRRLILISYFKKDGFFGDSRLGVDMVKTIYNMFRRPFELAGSIDTMANFCETDEFSEILKGIVLKHVSIELKREHMVKKGFRSEKPVKEKDNLLFLRVESKTPTVYQALELENCSVLYHAEKGVIKKEIDIEITEPLIDTMMNVFAIRIVNDHFPNFYDFKFFWKGASTYLKEKFLGSFTRHIVDLELRQKAIEKIIVPALIDVGSSKKNIQYLIAEYAGITAHPETWKEITDTLQKIVAAKKKATKKRKAKDDGSQDADKKSKQ